MSRMLDAPFSSSQDLSRSRSAHGQRSTPPTRHATGPITIGPSALFLSFPSISAEGRWQSTLRVSQGDRRLRAPQADRAAPITTTGMTGGTGWSAGCLGGLFGRGLARSGRLFRWVARLAAATAGPGRSGAAALGLRRGVAAADLLGGRATPVDGPPIRTGLAEFSLNLSIHRLRYACFCMRLSGTVVGVLRRPQFSTLTGRCGHTVHGCSDVRGTQ